MAGKAQGNPNSPPPNVQQPLPAFAQKVNPDFVLVWNETVRAAITPASFERRDTFEYNLEEEGLLLQWEVNESEPHLHAVKIWAPLEVLVRYSEILKLRLPMKQLATEETCRNENYSSTSSSTFYDDSSASTAASPFMRMSSSTIKDFRTFWRNCWNKLNMKLDPDLFPEKFRRLTHVYSRDKEYLFDVDVSNMHEIFPMSTRSRIVQYILRRKAYKSEAELELDNFAFGYERLIKKDVYEAGYPLHDGTIHTKGSIRKLLADNWGTMKKTFKYQPFDTLKDYFGVNFTLYFAWLGYYTGMLGFASIFGLFCFIYGLASISGDQYVIDICNTSAEIVMCPVCDRACPYWKISDRCSYSKFVHLFDNDFTLAFALLMSVWTAFFLEYWKRYAAKITYRWDLTSFDVRDYTPRPEYVAELKKIYPQGTNSKEVEAGGGDKARFDFELRIPFWKRTLPFRLLSFSTVILLVVLAVSVVVGVIMYRMWFTYLLSQRRKSRQSDQNDKAWERIMISFTAALLNLIFIFIFGKVYERIAIALTEMEIPRTQTEFDSSYTLKIYLLQFINNYSSIFYVAFFKGAYAGDPHRYHRLFGVLRQEECGISCMPELCIQLFVIMFGKQAKSMVNEAFLPWCKRGVKRATARFKVAVLTGVEEDDAHPPSRKASRTEFCQWLEDYDLLEWGPFLLTDEYLEMVLQFGFVTIFVSAFPLAPLFALLNNLLELRIDASKMLRHYRRPVGIRVKDIGVWSDIVDGVVKVAILSNACIIALTSNFIPKLYYRFFYHDKNNPDYGTLRGYLNSSLTAFDTNDLEYAPESTDSVPFESSPICHFPTYRYDYKTGKNYEHTMEYWQIWLIRAVFIIVYENVVGVLLILLSWVIPDIPASLLQKMQREQRMVNDLIMKQELLRAHKSTSTRFYHGISAGNAMRPAQTSATLRNNFIHEKEKGHT